MARSKSEKHTLGMHLDYIRNSGKVIASRSDGLSSELASQFAWSNGANFSKKVLDADDSILLLSEMSDNKDPEVPHQMIDTR